MGEEINVAESGAGVVTAIEAPEEIGAAAPVEEVAVSKKMNMGLIIGIVIILILTVVIVFLIWPRGPGGVQRVYNAGAVEWNQNLGEDCITKKVCLNRNVKDGLFNSVSEDSTDRAVSPKDTEWAKGSCSSAGTYMVLFEAAENKYGENLVAEEGYCMHLISDDLYFDVQFLTWGNNIYSYTRTSYQN